MIDFSENQKRAIASGLTVVAVSAVIAFVACVGWFAVKVLSFLSPAIAPVIVGLFLSLFFKPYYVLWLKAVKNPTLAVVLMLMSVLVPLFCLVWFSGAFAAEQVKELLETGPQRAARVAEWFNGMFPNARPLADKLGIPYADWLAGFKESLGRLAVGFAGYVSSALNWLVSLIFFVYFLTRPSMSGRDYVKELPFLKEGTRDFVAEQVDAFTDIVVSFFQRQVVICICEGVMYGLGFMAVGLRFGFLIGFALGFLNLVPLLGTIVCMPVALPLAFWGAGGGGLRLSLVLAVWLAGQVLDGYLITPKIQGDKTGLGYAGVIFSFFFWGVVFHSFLGLLLAIPLSAFCVVLWRAVKSRYIKPVF